MKPATGNNFPQSRSTVSIQLRLGGHAFSADTLPADALHGDGPVECAIITPRTLLMPGGEFRCGTEERCLQIAGLAPLPDETAVHSAPSASLVAVMAVARGCLPVLRERLGSRLVFTSPLLHPPVHEGACTTLHQVDDTLYIRSYGPELRYAAALIAQTEADVLVHLTDLNAALGPCDHPIYLSGDGARETARLLRRYFRRVVCAS